MIEFIDHHTRIGYDIDLRVIKALTFIRDHLDEIPKNNKEFTEAMYDEMKQCRHDDPEVLTGLQCYVGYALSFGAKWYRGWPRNNIGTEYIKASFEAAQVNHDLIQTVLLLQSSYKDITIGSCDVYYCDPPYAASTEEYYKATKCFNHDEFWQWVRMVSRDNWVYVSEYNAPDDFTCIWEKNIVNELNGKTATEKLFTLTPELNLLDFC